MKIFKNNKITKGDYFIIIFPVLFLISLFFILSLPLKDVWLIESSDGWYIGEFDTEYEALEHCKFMKLGNETGCRDKVKKFGNLVLSISDSIAIKQP